MRKAAAGPLPPMPHRRSVRYWLVPLEEASLQRAMTSRIALLAYGGMSAHQSGMVVPGSMRARTQPRRFTLRQGRVILVGVPRARHPRAARETAAHALLGPAWDRWSGRHPRTARGCSPARELGAMGRSPPALLALTTVLSEGSRGVVLHTWDAQGKTLHPSRALVKDRCRNSCLICAARRERSQTPSTGHGTSHLAGDGSSAEAHPCPVRTKRWQRVHAQGSKRQRSGVEIFRSHAVGRNQGRSLCDPPGPGRGAAGKAGWACSPPTRAAHTGGALCEMY